MPTNDEWQNAVDNAKQQSYEENNKILQVVDEKGTINKHELVYFIREYFNDNNINYGNFSFEDCKPYI